MNLAQHRKKEKDRTGIPTYFLMALFVKHCIDFKFHDLILCFHDKTARLLEWLRYVATCTAAT